MIFNLLHRPPIIFGCGASFRTGMKVRELGCDKVLLVYDEGIKNAKIAEKIQENLAGAGVEVISYDGVTPDPEDKIVEEAAGLAREEEVQAVIGIGGGSCLDTTKAVNILLTNPSPISKYLDIYPEMNELKPLVLIPTTAGTGSELTTVAMITDSVSGIKQNILSDKCLPTLPIVDPELTLGLPPRPTAQTGLDALEAIRQFINNLDVPASFSEVGLDDKVLHKAAKIAATEPNQIYAPRMATSEDFMELFQS